MGFCSWKIIKLGAESIKSSTLTLESVNDIHSSHSFATSVIGVGDSITNNVSEESGEDVSDFLVNVEGDSLDSSTTCQSTDRWLGDALDQGTTGFAGVTLDANFSDSFSAFASFSDSCHLLVYKNGLVLYRILDFEGISEILLAEFLDSAFLILSTND